mmetsp:Transcript_7831/g.25727  ORF Transcript_7831/g.25727 Transcript_7831/m.25727 type:complete len:177 (+) Transcript_7831:53-583(+)
MFIFYVNGQGGRSALLSVAISVALMAAQYVPSWLVLSGGLLFIATTTILFGDHYSRVWREFCRPQPSDMDAVLSRLRSMPTEVWEPASDLSVHELRRRIPRRSDAVTALERSDLERAYANHFDVCSVCAEPWAPGDIYRRLEPCGHVFHIECIDRWALSSADKGLVPTCPLCKTKF